MNDGENVCFPSSGEFWNVADYSGARRQTSSSLTDIQGHSVWLVTATNQPLYGWREGGSESELRGKGRGLVTSCQRAGEERVLKEEVYCWEMELIP